MILQALCQYYERRAQDEENPIASDGYQFEEIPFVLVLNEQGELVEVDDTREREGKRNSGRKFLVPAAKKRSGKNSSDTANCLWDAAGYVLGHPSENKPLDHALRQREAFSLLISELDNKINDSGVQAVRRFLLNSTPQISETELARFPLLREAILVGSKLAFRCAGKVELICQSAAVHKFINHIDSEVNISPSRCLVSGRASSIMRLHPPIKGIRGGQPTGTNIVSFNSPAFCSYGWEQGDNAQIGALATYQYTTALNELLSRESKKCKTLDTHLTLVFWSQKSISLEDTFGDLFDSPPAQTNSDSEALRSLYSAPFSGHFFKGDAESRFYVLGLSPNVARLSIRFWLSAPVEQIANRIVKYLNDLRLVHHTNESGILTLFRLLRSVCLKEKLDQLPPRIAGEMLSSILESRQFPRTLLSRCLDRIRAEGGNCSYPRMAILKAYLSRTTAGTANNFQETLMALDENNDSPAYQCGRVFAVLERMQESAGSKANIREKYFSSACLNPGLILPRLIRMKNHFAAKLSAGGNIFYEKLLGDIQVNISLFPVALSLEQQALFTLGYYHQRHSLFSKKETENQITED